MSRNFNYNDSETLVVKMSKDKVQLIKTGNHVNGPDVIANACKLHLANNYSEAKEETSGSVVPFARANRTQSN